MSSRLHFQLKIYSFMLTHLFAEGFANPIYIAQKVLTSSSACILASHGAKRFAERHGFQTVSLSHLLAPETKTFFEHWKKQKSGNRTLNEAGVTGKKRLSQRGSLNVGQ